MPKRETPEDLEREDAVAAKLEPPWGCEVARRPVFTVVDRLVRRDILVGKCEIKCRTTPRLKYTTLMVDWSKVDALLRWQKDSGLCGFVVAQWTDDLQWWLANPAQHGPIRKGGRTDRNDPADIDDVVDIELKHFRTLAHSPMLQWSLEQIAAGAERETIIKLADTLTENEREMARLAFAYQRADSAERSSLARTLQRTRS